MNNPRWSRGAVLLRLSLCCVNNAIPSHPSAPQLRILETSKILPPVICLSPVPTLADLQVINDLHSVIRNRIFCILRVLYKQNYIECVLLRKNQSNKYLSTSALGTEPRAGQTQFLPLGRIS